MYLVRGRAPERGICGSASVHLSRIGNVGRRKIVAEDSPHLLRTLAIA
jgi:hypothetical protein